MNHHKWNLADSVTSIRILAAILLLIFAPFHLSFFVVYTIAGITDVLDGWIARSLKMTSEFGARLDSVADLLFYGVLFIRLLPTLLERLPLEIWYVVAIILLIRLTSYGIAAIKYHRFAALHTWLNKLTGASVFFLPYILDCSEGILYSWFIGVLAFVSSFEEFLIHLCCTDYCPNKKSILQ